MKKKTISIALLLSLLLTGISMPSKSVEASTQTRTVVVRVGTYNQKMDWVASPAWEAFGSQYGAFPSTYDYSEAGWAGTLTAARIRAVPTNQLEEWVRDRGSVPASGVRGPVLVPLGGPAPTFPSTILSTIVDPVTGLNVSGSIAKAGLPAVTSSPSTAPYISWGRANNYDKDQNYFYGVMSNNPSQTYDGVSFNSTKPPNSWAPQLTFYGLPLSQLNHDWTIDLAMSYQNPINGSWTTGLSWADPGVVDAEIFKNVFIGDNTHLMSNVGKTGYQALVPTSGTYRFRSEERIYYRPVATVNLRGGPSTDYPSKALVPSSADLQVTMTQSGWSLVRYNGISGWIRSDLLYVHRNEGGGTLNRYRRGITIPYSLTYNQSSYTQNYSGNIALPDYFDKYVADRWDIYVEYTGTVADTSMNNFRVAEVRTSPANAQIMQGENSVTQSLTVNYTVAHDMTATPSPIQVNPLVEIRLGGTLIWSGTIGMYQGTTVNRSVTIHNLNIPVGSHTLRVEVNADRRFTEQVPGISNPYLDNVRSITVPGLRYIGCDLPDTRRTSNTWSELWTRTAYGGTLIGPAGNQTCSLIAPSILTQTIEYNESYEITEAYFRSKWSRDLGYNDLPSRGPGWVRIEEGTHVKIKAGYAFEMIAVTYYRTNRWIEVYTETSGPAYDGPNGPGVCGFRVVTPKVTPTPNPNVMFINLSLGASGGNICRIMTPTSTSGQWYRNEKTFELPLAATLGGLAERKLYTNVGGYAGVYDISISTPRTDRPNAFRGYEAETPVNLTNKGHLHDHINFSLEVLGQDDIKSHIVQ